ncbi:hypothetical protein [Blastopirellula marina]|uniref:EF-hand domain-containing protein n=1 Tax=Blastopirellula marina TaxID=124 RepID=A0A2S8G8W1_9BACT|nr:hypothetical protein [Blastopirellula marina]PQO40869.1 hypothetical protein C5Y98_04635 [Blastopirellula marina]PTL45751.1 hypothetical protein C5Y97_04635 [Blastopirellula marina]
MKKTRSRTAYRNSIARNWKHQVGFEALEVREMLDASGELISLRLEATDLNGNPIQQVAQGESFLVTAYIEDRRGEPGVTVNVDTENDILANPFGFFTAYFNVTYDSVGFDFDESYGVHIGPTISPVVVSTPGTDIDGYIERLGVQNIDLSGHLHSAEVELLSFRMIAQQPGTYNMAEGINPHFHFDVVDYIENPNQLPEDWAVNYVDGVPQLDRLTGQDFIAATEDADEYFSLYHYGQQRLTASDQVYFEGVGLQVIAAGQDADYEMRYVVSPTSTTGGEVATLPENLEYIDEWNYFYVEIYAKAPSGYAVTNSVVTVSYNPDDFEFVQAIGRTQDSTNLRYSVSFTDVDDENGLATIGFSTLSSDLGDDQYALIGRVQLRSLMELAVDYTNGELQATSSSVISLSDTNATVTHTSTGASAVVNGTTPTGSSFDVWPVIYDVANGEDRTVGLADFSDFVGAFGKTVNGDPSIRKLDFDHNGSVGLSDFALFVRNFGKSDATNSTRVYPEGYPGDLSGSAALMGSSFLLEGEPIDSRSSMSQPIPIVETSAPATTSSSSTDTIASSLLSLPATTPSSPESSTQVPDEDEADTSVPTSSPDSYVSNLEDQSDLLALTSNQWDDSLASDEEETDFAASADEVLALWDEENEL